MHPQLPPPDPHEWHDIGPTRDTSFPGPVAIFLDGASADERISDAILDLRPGVLIVFASR